jgi:hypothetical protein
LLLTCGFRALDLAEKVRTIFALFLIKRVSCSVVFLDSGRLVGFFSRLWDQWNAFFISLIRILTFRALQVSSYRYR